VSLSSSSPCSRPTRHGAPETGEPAARRGLGGRPDGYPETMSTDAGTPDQPPRDHPQDPAEGVDPDPAGDRTGQPREDQPQVHPQDPAEGQDDPGAVEE
jgi:hypothetical protein